MEPSEVHPLHSLSGLTAAVVGNDGSGKSALVAALTDLSGLPVPLPAPSSPAPSSSAPLARLLRSPPLRLLQGQFSRVSRALRLERVLRSSPLRFLQGQFARVSREIRLARTRGSCIPHVLPTGDDSAPLILLEAIGGSGASFLRTSAQSRHVNVIIFVTRLDEGRVVADDRIVMVRLARTLGTSFLDRTLFVFTHGDATPPHRLSFKQFVRGRRDVLWGLIMDIVPPVPVGTPHVVVEPSFRDAFVSPVPADLFTERGVIFDRKFRAPWSRRPVPTSSEEHNGVVINDTSPIPPPLAQRIAEVDLSLSVPEQFAVLDAPQPGEDPAEFERYREAPPPVVAVVELSGLCPTNQHGERILPDGTAWVPGLVNSVAERAIRDGSDAGTVELATPPQSVGPWLGFRGAVAAILSDPRGVLLVQVLLGGLVTTAIERMHEVIVDARERREEKDLVVGISDEEFETLTQKDPDEGITVLSLEGGGKGKDEVKLEERELFGSLEDAEEEFFGSVPREGSFGPRAGPDQMNEQGGNSSSESSSSST